jgi:4-hydroxy-tetrahydrodipicolinate reductase
MNVEYILIAGARGKMGTPFVATCLDDDALCLVATTSRRLAGQTIQQHADVVTQATVKEAIAQATHPPTVGVELTHPSTVYANVLAMIDAGIAPVIGATGLTPAQEKEIDAKLKAKKLPGLLVPNFSIGAVLMMRFAAEASRYFDHAEIIELHHNQKADAPSGTSLRTVEMMQAVRPDFGKTNGVEHETVAGARGATSKGNIHVHSVRLPGLVAHQEVLFGDMGQMLSLRHDSFNRSCFMAGIALCCKKVRLLESGLHHGLETVLSL